jgi:hypothetical protein
MRVHGRFDMGGGGGAQGDKQVFRGEGKGNVVYNRYEVFLVLSFKSLTFNMSSLTLDVRRRI